MSDKIFIIDFDDSFTYNIANVIFPHEKRLSVISHRDFFNTEIKKILNSNQKLAVILGPGPGHPDEYQSYFRSIRKLQQRKNVYLMGICLGHQIIGKAKGHKIAFSKEQIHGLSVKIEFKGKFFSVQRYNSLAVFINGQETDILEYPRGISYQFHPESIGTPNNSVFFQDLLFFLK